MLDYRLVSVFEAVLLECTGLVCSDLACDLDLTVLVGL